MLAASPSHLLASPSGSPSAVAKRESVPGNRCRRVPTLPLLGQSDVSEPATAVIEWPRAQTSQKGKAGPISVVGI